MDAAVGKCVLPEDTSFSSFRGFIEVQGVSYQVRIRHPADAGRFRPEASGFWCDNALSHLLAGHSALVERRLLQSKGVSDFLVEVSHIITNLARLGPPGATSSPSTIPSSSLPPPTYYNQLLKDLEVIGFDRLLSLEESTGRLQLKLVDEAKRTHALHVYLPPGYPKEAPVCSMQVPDTAVVPVHWGGGAGLADLVCKYEAQLALLQPFWAVMDDWDQHTWVLEPSPPLYCHSTRRIALGRSLSMTIEVDTRTPYGLCEIRFFGPEAKAEKLRARLHAGVSSWNHDATPRLNLARILALAFPAPAISAQDDFNLECGICYGYKLGPKGLVPDVVCDNEKCSRSFHRSCLYSWLTAIPTSRSSFNTVFGVCPYCSQSISASSLSTA